MDIAAVKRSVLERTYQQNPIGPAFSNVSNNGFSQAAQEAESRLTHKEADILNITMITDSATGEVYGCAAGYSEASTPENPIIRVTMTSSNGKKETYDVAVNQVNPASATGLEMFALCCYADHQGMGRGGLGSWVRVKTMMENAAANGYQKGFSGKEAFINQKTDWPAVVSRMTEDYLRAGIYQQYQQGQALLDMMKKFERQEHEEDPWQAIAARKEEIQEKLRNGDTEVKYQIGGSSYTQKEWERMMEQFDSLEEIIRHMMEERREKQRQYAFRQVLGEPEEKNVS